MKNGRAILVGWFFGHHRVLVELTLWVVRMAMERREVHFSGRVQGVGFRYTTRQIAADYGVSGFVKNLPDGRVQMVVEGEGAEIDELLEAIQGEMRGNIRDTRVDRTDYQGAFDNFDITF